MGFAYRSLLGALVYAYTTCRLDISYAICFLSRYATCPNELCYTALKGVARYLRAHKDYGIVYWRSRPRTDLPKIDIPEPLPSNNDEELPTFPRPKSLSTLEGFVDASHASCAETRRSVTGLVFMLAGGAIAYKSKLQNSVSTSSTEAELIAAVQAAKIAKYYRSVLLELGYPQLESTILHEDNESAIKIINHNRPTERTRHVDIAWFAIQEWRRNNEINISR